MCKRIFSISDKVSLGFEMIANQKDTAIVTDIQNSLGIINDLMINENYTDSISLAKNRTVANELRNIEKYVVDRMGIKIKILPDMNSNFGVVPVTALNYNTINDTGEDNYKRMKAVMELYGKEDNVKPDEISTLFGNETKVFSLITKSFEELETSLNLKGIKIDLVNCKITGLPKDFIVFMMGDICHMLLELKLSVNELTAVLFHEVGHAFTHIEYASRTYSTTAVLIDTLQADMLRGNNTLRKSLVLAYEHAFKTKMTTVESETEVSAMITIANRYIDSSRVTNHSNISYTDSEQLADQFAGKFGLTQDLTHALVKFNKDAKSLEMAIVQTSFYVFIIYTIIGFLMTLSLLSGLSLGLAVGFGVAMVMSIVSFVDSILTSGGTSRQNTYDDIKRRLERIVNEAIRSLRMSELSTDDKKGLIKTCDTLIKILETYPEDQVNIFDKVIRWINKNGSSEHINSRNFEELIEDLQSNRVYLAAAKFKDLK